MNDAINFLKACAKERMTGTYNVVFSDGRVVAYGSAEPRLPKIERKPMRYCGLVVDVSI